MISCTALAWLIIVGLVKHTSIWGSQSGLMSLISVIFCGNHQKIERIRLDQNYSLWYHSSYHGWTKRCRHEGVCLGSCSGNKSGLAKERARHRTSPRNIPISRASEHEFILWMWLLTENGDVSIVSAWSWGVGGHDPDEVLDGGLSSAWDKITEC